MRNIIIGFLVSVSVRPRAEIDERLRAVGRDARLVAAPHFEGGELEGKWREKEVGVVAVLKELARAVEDAHEPVFSVVAVDVDDGGVGDEEDADGDGFLRGAKGEISWGVGQ